MVVGAAAASERQSVMAHRMLSRLVLLIVATAACGCAKSGAPSATAGNVDRALEDRLIRQLRDGDPYEKMDAARQLEQRGVVRAVPQLLVEVRDKYPRPTYVEKPNSRFSHDYDAYMIWNGEKVPYIDYHEPLFSALSRLAVPYFGNDAQWFAAIDEWIAKNLPSADEP